MALHFLARYELPALSALPVGASDSRRAPARSLLRPPLPACSLRPTPGRRHAAVRLRLAAALGRLLQHTAAGSPAPPPPTSSREADSLVPPPRSLAAGDLDSRGKSAPRASSAGSLWPSSTPASSAPTATTRLAWPTGLLRRHAAASDRAGCPPASAPPLGPAAPGLHTHRAPALPPCRLRSALRACPAPTPSLACRQCGPATTASLHRPAPAAPRFPAASGSPTAPRAWLDPASSRAGYCAAACSHAGCGRPGRLPPTPWLARR
nr:wiskott-Aldrich syndrome protein homolog 1-like [Aegilops tauschii subsp. strangulata]